MSMLFNSVQPESLKSTYTQYDTIDFVLNFENQFLVANSLRIDGNFDVSDANDPNLKAIQFDRKTGVQSLLQTITTDYQNAGVVENCTDYPRFVRSYMDCNATDADAFNSTQLCELKAPSDTIARSLLNNEENIDAGIPNGYNVDFSVKPMIALNRAISQPIMDSKGNVVAGNIYIDFKKTGAITIKIRLATVNASLFGTDVDGNTTYNLSNLKLSYYTVSDANSTVPVLMKSYSGLKQIVNSSLVNINTKVPAVCSGVSCSFINLLRMNQPTYNNLETERLPNVDEVVFMFNSSTNKYITYPLRTQIEIAEHYLESMNVTGHSQLSRTQNTGYGIGLDFNDQIDLRNNMFSCQIRSGVTGGNNTYQMFMYFHTLLTV